MMTSSLTVIPPAIAQMFIEAIASRAVTEADRYGLMAALLDLDRELDAAECQAVDEILGRLRCPYQAASNHLTPSMVSQNRPVQNSQVRCFWFKGSH
ncbi:MAG: hypothetical protein ACPGVO_05980 [Spirulinaceae cyanobacterium]